MKTLKVPSCIYVKIFFSLAVNIYILLSIKDPLLVKVKYNVCDK